MTQAQRRDILRKVFQHHHDLSQAWEGWRDLGISIEASFPHHAWRMAGLMLQQTEERFGLGDLLTWWFYETPRPTQIVNRYPGVERWCTLTTDEDLLNYIDTYHPITESGGVA